MVLMLAPVMFDMGIVVWESMNLNQANVIFGAKVIEYSFWLFLSGILTMVAGWLRLQKTDKT